MHQNSSEIQECAAIGQITLCCSTGWLQLATAGSSHSTLPPSAPHTHTRTYDIFRSHLRCSAGHFLHVVLGLGRGRRSQRCSLCVCEWGRGGRWADRRAVKRVCAHQNSNETPDPSTGCQHTFVGAVAATAAAAATKSSPYVHLGGMGEERKG